MHSHRFPSFREFKAYPCSPILAMTTMVSQPDLPVNQPTGPATELGGYSDSTVVANPAPGIRDTPPDMLASVKQSLCSAGLARQAFLDRPFSTGLAAHGRQLSTRRTYDS